MTAESPERVVRRSPIRTLAVSLDRHPRLRLLALLGLPVGALTLVYFGSLLILFVNSFWSRDPFTGLVVRDFTVANFAKLLPRISFVGGELVIANELFTIVLLRTLVMAAAVTASCAALAFPVAYFMARVASPRVRGALVVLILTPLWASYLIKAYSWRLILSDDGVLNWLLAPLGVTGPGYTEIGLWLVFTYLWLPYMILPIYAGLERIPSSLLEASADLGGRSWRTFRHVILPLVFPSVVAGSIFTFSLTLGDYIAPGLITTRQFVGNLILSNFGVPDLPLAAAQALVPLLIMVVYLLIARRLGAFEAL